MTIFAILIGLAANAVGWWHDYDYSKRFIYYRANEGNKLFQDRYGMMHRWKPLAGLAAGQAFAVGVGLLAVAFGHADEAHFGYMAAAIGAGLTHFLQAKLKLAKRLRSDRESQIKSRESLKRLLVDGDRGASIQKITNFGLRTVKGRGGAYWHPAVQFLRVSAVDAFEAKPLIAELLYDWLLIPEAGGLVTESEYREQLKRIWGDIKFHPER